MFTSASAAIGVLVTSPLPPTLFRRNISRCFSNSICSFFNLSSSMASANTPPSCMCCSRSILSCEFISTENFRCFACGLFGRNIGCAVLFPLKSYPANSSSVLFSANDPARSPSLDAAAECSPSALLVFIASNSSTTIAVLLFFPSGRSFAARLKLSGAFTTKTNGLGFTRLPVPFRFRSCSILDARCCASSIRDPDPRRLPPN